MSAQVIQAEVVLGVSGLPGGHVPSFLQLSFNPQLLDRAGTPASLAETLQHNAKPGQPSVPTAQRPPLPPARSAAAPSAPVPVAAAHEQLQMQLPPEQQQQQAVQVMAAGGQNAPPPLSLEQHTPAEPMHSNWWANGKLAYRETPAEEAGWVEHSGVATGMDPAYQQYHQQMQYNLQQYAAAAAAGDAFGNGVGQAVVDEHQAAGHFAAGHGTVGVQVSAADKGASSRRRASSGRGRSRSRHTISSEPNSEADDHHMEHQQHPAAKQRRKEQPALEAESQLLLLGFLSAVVGDNAMLEQCLVHAVSFETQQEAMLQQYMGALQVSQQPSKRVGVLEQYQIAQSLAMNVRGRAALSLVWQLPLAFSSARSMLAVGGVFTLEDMCRECDAELTQHMASFDFEARGLRKSKIEGQVEALADMLRDTMEQLLVEAGHVPDKAPSQRAPQPARPLPRCIIANREPFAHKEWRKEPYDPRPYVNLTNYAITSNVPRDAKQLKWKLSTQRQDAAGDGFAEKHHDLSPQQLKEKEQQIVQQVLHRQALLKGRDVIEVDCWGMDCYTRRNVFDAVLEADVFQHLRGAQEQQQQQPEEEGSAHCASQQQLVKAEFEQKQPEGDVIDADRTFSPRSVQQQGSAEIPTQHAADGRQLSSPPAHPQQSRNASPSRPSEPGVGAASEQLQVLQTMCGATQAAEGSPEHRAPEAEEPEEAQRKSKRSRKRVMYADEAMEELKAQAREHKRTNREALLAKYYPPRANYSKAEEDAVHEWIDAVFIPAVNAAGNQGWDMVQVATNIRQQAQAQAHQVNAQAAEAVLNQFINSGYPWFRLHPKGRGVIVTRPEGVAPFTFVEEYLGEVHTGWRWFEIQDAIKKITQKDLPDFYNIALERPTDDPDGYDILFVDAAFMGSFASRMSHSCTPNCQAVVVSCGGRLTVALYTIRHVAPGEELTFDYSCVTESEDEFKQAYCMCSTRHCRGSYLYYTGSKAYMQVLEAKHTFLDRQALLLRCCTEPLTEADTARLQQAGLRGSVLGRPDVDCNPVTPDWLRKWAALTLEFVELERHQLPGELQALPPPLTQTPADSVAAAIGVKLNRLQNICISLDKAKHCLDQTGQCRDPPLAVMGDEEVAEYLWEGDRSVAKRAVKAAAARLLGQEDSEIVQAASSAAEYQAAAQHLQYSYPLLALLLTHLTQTVTGAEAARAELQQVVAKLRDIDIVAGGGHTRAADVLQLYASTQVWFTASRDYISFSSPPLQLHEEMISMHGGLETADSKRGIRRSSSGSGLGNTAAGSSTSSAGGRRRWVGGDSSGDDEYDPDASSDDEEAVRRRGTSRGRGRWGAGSGRGGMAYKPVRGINPKILEKRYGPHYVWAQLSSWFKQTVYDPTASLSADRRGTLSLPEIESCYATKERYDAKERHRLINHVLRTPERQWTSSVWSFRNEAKVYGSPMFDAFWGELVRGVPRATPLQQLADMLLAAAVPYGLGGSGRRSGKTGKGSNKGKGGKATAGSSNDAAALQGRADERAAGAASSGVGHDCCGIGPVPDGTVNEAIGRSLASAATSVSGGAE